ncbi:MAG TPA: polyphosphate kinase 1 [Saprospiraceae bacterium]|nr:polyphosphate kinase 1 [Saprospiraceae bacterium]
MQFENRDISWININGRVLPEAVDTQNPLIEKIKFLGIFSNNRDEFFRVRIATLRRMINIAPKGSKQKKSLSEELESILKVVEYQEKAYTAAFIKILKELKKENIFLVNETELTESQGDFVKEYFKTKVRPYLFPIMIDYFETGQVLNDTTIYLAVNLSDNDKRKKERHVLIEVPSEAPRFLKLHSEDENVYFMFLEDVIRYNLSDLFSIWDYDNISAHIIKFTRDSELDIDNDVSKSFLEIMEESVKKRKKGIPVRFIYDRTIPSALLEKIIKKLNFTTKNYQLRGGGRYHNFKDLMSFPSLKEELMFKKQDSFRHKDLVENDSIFKVLRKKDVLLHFPYHSFDPIIDFIREASIDPKVKSIKMTFYRAAKHSLAMNALINAARNGKHVTVFMELQARVDEQAKILWTQKLQSEGVKVLPTIPGMKVHAKLIIIRYKEAGKNFFFSNISTGNFNESTARVYSDLSLLTANQDIGHDVYNFFELIESRYRPPEFRLSYVSPFHIRSFFDEKLEREIKNYKEGKEAWVILKLNSLADKEIAFKIKQTASEGVKIDMIIRGINIMPTNVPNETENINAFSIVGRFLEHSRIFIFANGGNPEYYFGSADLMSRNLDHRFEIICPILDKDIKEEVMQTIKLQQNDTEKYRSLNYGEVNKYTRRRSQFPHLNSQTAIYEYLKNKNS